MTRCGAHWNQYECVRLVGHDGRHATERNITTWSDEFCTSRTDQTMVADERISQFEMSRLTSISEGLAPSDHEVMLMARELLAVRAERTNEAHRAQLDEAVASVARSLETQLALKVRSILLHSGPLRDPYNPGCVGWIDKRMRDFIDDLARNAVGGVQHLIARESE